MNTHQMQIDIKTKMRTFEGDRDIFIIFQAKSLTLDGPHHVVARHYYARERSKCIGAHDR